MTFKTLIISSVAILSLAACDGGKKDDDKMVQQESAEETSVTPSVVDTVIDQVKEAITLDTSSVEAFKDSLSAMKDSLSADDKSKLTAALGTLAQKAVTEKSEGGGLMDMAKDVASGGSAEDQVYKSFKDKLSGMNFDEIIDYAG